MVYIPHNKQDEKKQKQVDEVTCYDALHNFIYYGIGWATNAGVGVLAAEYAFNRSGNFVYNTREKAVDYAMNMAEKLFSNGKLEDFTKNIGERLNEIGLGGEAAKILQEQAKDGKFKQAFYELHSKNGGYEGIAKMLGENFDAKEIKEAADHMINKQGGRELFNTAAVLATLCVGGFAVMVPMKLMEDNKRWLVEQLDHKVVDPINSVLGKAPKTEEAKAVLEEKRKQRYEEIEAEPKQTWGSMLTSRIIALVPLYALHAAWWNENNAIKYAGGAIAGAEITNPSPEIGFGGVGHYAKKTGDLVGGTVYDILPESWQDGITSHVTQNADKFAAGADIGKRWFSQKAEWLIFDYIYALAAATTTEKLTGKLVKVFDNNSDEQEKPQPFSKVETAIHGGNLQERFNNLAFSV